MTTIKKGQYLIWGLCIILLLNSCGIRNDKEGVGDDHIALNVRKQLDQPAKDFYLSDLSQSIEYIKLDSNTSFFLSNISNLKIAGDYIFISDGRGLYQYDADGGFIREIGLKGRGPGETLGPIRFAIDSYNNEILVYSSSSRVVNIFDMETGEYISAFQADFFVSGFEVLKDGVIAFFTGEVQDNVNEVIFTDKEGNIFNQIVNSLRSEMKGNVLGIPSVYQNEENLYYQYNYRDTLYRINQQLDRSAFAVFDFDNRESHNEFLIVPDPDNMVTFYPDYISIPRVLHNNGFLFATLQKGIYPGVKQDLQRMVYERATGTLNPTDGFINDLDGGMTFWPRWSSEGLLIDYHHAYEILEYYHNSRSEEQHSEAFIDLVSNLGDNDNPVLMVVRE